MNIGHVVRKYYREACSQQHKIATDHAMKEIMQSKCPFDSVHVKKWMQDYGLFQGIQGIDRDRIVNTVKSNIPAINAEPITEARELTILRKFGQLFTALYNTVNRRWLSATSKLLWCAFPDDIVIYDSFVERAIIVLQWYDEELSKLPRLGNIPPLKSAEDIQELTNYYNRYQNMVYCLFQQNRTILDELRQETKETYLHDIRIFDKILWITSNRKLNPTIEEGA